MFEGQESVNILQLVPTLIKKTEFNKIHICDESYIHLVQSQEYFTGPKIFI
jgi:hypothetical protein